MVVRGKLFQLQGQLLWPLKIKKSENCFHKMQRCPDFIVTKSDTFMIPPSGHFP
jgi:hypothetical protein